MRLLRPLLTLVVAAATVAACAPAGMSPPVAPVAVKPAGILVDVGQGRAGAVLTPLVTTAQAPAAGRRGADRALMAQVQENTAATIVHLVVKVFEGTGPEVYRTETDVPAAALGNAITFVGLRDNRTYRVRAYAYASAGQDDKISIDASSFTDIVVGDDDRPTVANLPVLLTSVPFSGRATATAIAIANGGHQTDGAEMLTLGEPLDEFVFVDELAGDASPGYVDDTYANARFDSPWEVAAVGRAIYVADSTNHVIRRIDVDGLVTTFVGTQGVQGTTDGPAGTALFDNPRQLTADAAGNLYVLQHGSGAYPPTQLVRKITPAGVVTTIAGGPRDGSVPSCIGSAARFADPNGMAVDPAGTYLYIGDAHNQVIRRIDLTDPQFTTTVIAGSQNQTGSANGAVGTSARFLYPGTLAIDLEGNLIVADGNPHVRKIDVNAGGFPVTPIAGDPVAPAQVDGGVAAARFRNIADLAVDAQGNILVLDNGDGGVAGETNRLRKITFGAGGAITVNSLAGNGYGHVVGPGLGVGGARGEWGNARGMTLDAVGELIFIEGHRLRWIYPGGGA